MNSPIAQDSAAQSPGQVSHSSLFQRSGENMVENCPESPCLARELERFYQNDLYDVLGSPVQERSLQEDVIRQAKTELKHHDSAINKHLVKKAVLEEKSKPWRLGSAVSSNVVDSEGSTVGRFQSEPAVEKRIRELEEASKRQDLAIQKHNTKKAALERGIKRNLDYEPGQPSKKPVFEAAEEDYEGLLGPACPGGFTELQTARPGEFTIENSSRKLRSLRRSPDRSYNSRSTNSTVEPLSGFMDVEPIALHYDDSGMIAEASSGRVLNSEEADIVLRFCDLDSAKFRSSSRDNYRIESPGDQATSGDIIQEPPRQIPLKEIIERDKQPDREYASEGPASSGRSFTHWLLRRRPSSFGSVMNGMFEKFERVAIGAWPARKSRDKRAVPVEDSVNK